MSSGCAIVESCDACLYHLRTVIRRLSVVCSVPLCIISVTDGKSLFLMLSRKRSSIAWMVDHH